MMKSETAGEKPPKANWILAIAGLIILAGAYWIAVSIEEPMEAMLWFMVAVLMVIVATYLLFIAGSVAFCRLMQKKKNYYYKTRHFVSISSMVYRMKRNGAGLASICILSTMVLVMVSSTVCLYASIEGNLAKGYPQQFSVEMASGSSIEDKDREEKLKETAELNTGSYLCTTVVTKENSKTIKGWKIPLTRKSFVISYDGTVKAGIKNLTKAEVIPSEGNVVIKLPEIEITDITIDNDSFKIMDESNNIFNSISIGDLNDAQKELKKKMKESAVEKGVLDIAKNNAETLLSEMLKSPTGDYDVKVEWK